MIYPSVDMFLDRPYRRGLLPSAVLTVATSSSQNSSFDEKSTSMGKNASGLEFLD
jgi:hypothetical protein